MTPQQIAMIKILKDRNINQVTVTPASSFEINCARLTLTEIGDGKFTATIEQLEAYYKRQGNN